ncbi:hypothetical protein rosmuc_04198 [Roseovarius mucosus DSM 17069]|uniref:Uncharacterized protein n=1 Tax=Roseovarius mucosus DSM 17069 TaxID=1288298 RepID=A0A0A0HDV4_9RHOB|nr:hypothetical protein rosmuc_04198 [Roseovarius mucosus DSM 17069]
MDELGRGVIAHQVHAIAPFDERQAFGRQALKLGGFHLGAVLLALEAALRLFVLIERPLDPGRGAVEEVDLAPEHLFEVGFHAGVFQGRDEGVKDVGDGDREALPIRHRARIGLVKGAVAVELQLVERMGGLGCGVGGFICVVMGVDRHRFLPPGLSRPRVIPRGLHGLRKPSRGPPLHPLFGAGTHVEEDGGRLICLSRCKARARPSRRKSVAPHP